MTVSAVRAVDVTMTMVVGVVPFVRVLPAVHVIVTMVVIVIAAVNVSVSVLVVMATALAVTVTNLFARPSAAAHGASGRAVRAEIKRKAAMAAPKPLSMLTTVTPEAHDESMPKSAVNPPSDTP